ncbi:MAG: histidine phosphatase family protein [Hyphomicrobiales bacterium]
MLFLIRHGETGWNADGRLQGQLDTELNARGRAQPCESAKVLAAVHPSVAAASFVASPLERARQSLDILMRKLVALDALAAPKPYGTDDRLKELCFGRWEGLTWKEVRRGDPVHYAARNADVWNVAPPGGESYAALALRAGPLLASLPPGAVVVSHGGVGRVALNLFAGMTPGEAAKAPMRQGDVLVIDQGRARWGTGALVGAEAN